MCVYKLILISSFLACYCSKLPCLTRQQRETSYNTNPSQNPDSIGIVFGKSGAGEAIVANKIKGVRAILALNEENVRLSREHNNANVLSIGSILVSNEQAVSLIRLFINTPFSNEERHIRRIEKIKEIEQQD